jgi:hypothetical protein
MENNLVCRVSGNAISFSGPRAGPNQGSTVKNNILAFTRQSLLNSYDPYSFGTVPPLPMFFTASNNLFYFDRNGAESFTSKADAPTPAKPSRHSSNGTAISIGVRMEDLPLIPKPSTCNRASTRVEAAAIRSYGPITPSRAGRAGRRRE